MISRVPKHLPRGFWGPNREPLPLNSSAFVYLRTPGFNHTISFKEKTPCLSAPIFISSSKMSYCRRQLVNGLFPISTPMPLVTSFQFLINVNPAVPTDVLFHVAGLKCLVLLALHCHLYLTDLVSSNFCSAVIHISSWAKQHLTRVPNRSRMGQMKM